MKLLFAGLPLVDGVNTLALRLELDADDISNVFFFNFLDNGDD